MYRVKYRKISSSDCGSGYFTFIFYRSRENNLSILQNLVTLSVWNTFFEIIRYLKIFWNAGLALHDCFLTTTSPNFTLKKKGIHSPEMISYHIIYWHVKLFTWMAIMLTRNYNTRTLYCLLPCVRYKTTKTPSDDSQSTGD